MHQKIEEVVSEDIQSSPKMIESNGRHKKGAVTTGLVVNSTPQLGIYKKLGDLTRVFDKRVSLDDMIVVVLKRIFKRIGIGQEDQEGDEEAEKMISSHELFTSLAFLEADSFRPANLFRLDE